jgi:hypothetical protein
MTLVTKHLLTEREVRYYSMSRFVSHYGLVNLSHARMSYHGLFIANGLVP